MSSFSQSTSFYWYAPPRDLHSFPTRRSSDLKRYRNSSYGVFNGRLSLDMDLPRGDALQVSLWGKNLFNKKHPVHTLGLGSPIATAQEPAGWTQTARQWNEPTTWSVKLIYSYR